MEPKDVHPTQFGEYTCWGVPAGVSNIMLLENTGLCTLTPKTFLPHLRRYLQIHKIGFI